MPLLSLKIIFSNTGSAPVIDMAPPLEPLPLIIVNPEICTESFSSLLNTNAEPRFSQSIIVVAAPDVERIMRVRPCIFKLRLLIPSYVPAASSKVSRLEDLFNPSAIVFSAVALVNPSLLLLPSVSSI